MRYFCSLFVFITLWMFSSAFLRGLRDKDCKFVFNTDDFPNYSPSMFVVDDKENFELVTPVKSGLSNVVLLEEHSSVLVSCHGDGNSFEDTSISEYPSEVFDCIEGKLTNGVEEYDLKDLQCKSRTKSYLKATGVDCAEKRGKLLEIGFEVQSMEVQFSYPLIQACFNVEQSLTYYTQHVVDGKALLAAEGETSRPMFSQGMKELYPNFNPNDLYKQTAQSSLFTDLLGSSNLSAAIMNVTYLARGHLSPDNDFSFAATQFATYYYVNVAPEWQSLNAGLWLALENAVRDLARSTEDKYDIYTGTTGVLALPNKEGVKIEIWLTENQLPVPELFWKVMVDRSTGNGMAFVALNNPFKEDLVSWPCTDICTGNGWGTETWRNSQICCDVDELKNKLADIPDIVVTGVLRGPRAPMRLVKRKPSKPNLQLQHFFSLMDQLKITN